METRNATSNRHDPHDPRHAAHPALRHLPRPVRRRAPTHPAERALPTVKTHDYYEMLKGRAREIRAEYGFVTPRVLRSDLRRIYKDHGIRFDKRPFTKKIRGAYFNDDFGVHIAIAE